MTEEWRIYQNSHARGNRSARWSVEAPPWRRPQESPGEDFMARDERADSLPPDFYYLASQRVINTVNLALRLRRPILVTGAPGTGKTSLAYSIASELGLGPVLEWLITSRSTVRQGLYEYDALARVNDMNLADKASGAGADVLEDAARDIGRYIA